MTLRIENLRGELKKLKKFYLQSCKCCPAILPLANFTERVRSPNLGASPQKQGWEEKHPRRMASLHSAVQGKTPNWVTFQLRVKRDCYHLPNKAPGSSSWSLSLGGVGEVGLQFPGLLGNLPPAENRCVTKTKTSQSKVEMLNNYVW